MSASTPGMLPTEPRLNDREGQAASLREVKQDVARLKHDAAEYATDAAHTGLDAVKSGSTQVIEAGKSAAASAQESHKKMCAYVTAHPTASVLIAAGIGALLARILPRG